MFFNNLPSLHERIVVLLYRGYELMAEGQEKAAFWTALGGKGEYSTSPKLVVTNIFLFHPLNVECTLTFVA